MAEHNFPGNVDGRGFDSESTPSRLNITIDVRYWLKADSLRSEKHVCFRPQSGLYFYGPMSPLLAKSGHRDTVERLTKNAD